MDYSTPFVIGTQSKSDSRDTGDSLEGYVAEFRYYFQVLDQDELTAIQDELLYKYGASCDASAPPANGEVGDCTNELISGTTCQPTCDVGYAASGPSTCKDGVLSPAVCIGVLHLVADDITDVDAGNLVQSWSDHTGNGLSLSSFVAAPELVDGGDISTGALFNGHKAVRFGESGITGLSLPTSALQLSTSLEGMTVVAVMSTDDSRDATAPFLFDRGTWHLEGLGFTSRQPKCKYTRQRITAVHLGRTAAPPIENGKMYVVTAQYKFAKSGVSGHQLATTQHGNLSNPDLIPLQTHTWTGTGVDYSTPFVIGTQSKSDSRTDGRWFEGYVAEFRYYFQVLDQDELNAIQDELLDKYVGRLKVSERAKLTADDGAAE